MIIQDGTIGVGKSKAVLANKIFFRCVKEVGCIQHTYFTVEGKLIEGKAGRNGNVFGFLIVDHKVELLIFGGSFFFFLYFDDALI